MHDERMHEGACPAFQLVPGTAGVGAFSQEKRPPFWLLYSSWSARLPEGNKKQKRNRHPTPPAKNPEARSGGSPWSRAATAPASQPRAQNDSGPPGRSAGRNASGARAERPQAFEAAAPLRARPPLPAAARAAPAENPSRAQSVAGRGLQEGGAPGAVAGGGGGRGEGAESRQGGGARRTCHFPGDQRRRSSEGAGAGSVHQRARGDRTLTSAPASAASGRKVGAHRVQRGC